MVVVIGLLMLGFGKCAGEVSRFSQCSVALSELAASLGVTDPFVDNL